MVATLDSRQRDYYARTAHWYDDAYDNAPEHSIAMRLATSLLRDLRVRSALDVGCGTGRGLRALRDVLPEVEAVGIDPSSAMLNIAHNKHGLSANKLVTGVGEALPFADRSFDAVLAIGILHHVPDPWIVVAEMLRVSRTVLVISDGNRYADGNWAIRATKLAMRATQVLDRVDRLRYGPDRSFETEGDGVAYPFSLFDILPRLRASCAQMIVTPTTGDQFMNSFPLGAARHLFIAALHRPLTAESSVQ